MSPLSTENKTTAPIEDQFEKLDSELRDIQKELSQAMDVWRTTLLTEKEELKSSFETKYADWKKQGQSFERDRIAYEQKIQELQHFFEGKLKLAEQNAFQALQQMEATWKAEKEQLEKSSYTQTQENKMRLQILESEHQKQMALLQQLQHQNTQLQVHVNEKDQHLQMLFHEKSNWQAERNNYEQQKEIWQAILSKRVEEAQKKESFWISQQEQQERLISQLQHDLLMARAQVADIEKRSQLPVQSYVNSLESQVQALNTFIRQYMPYSTPSQHESYRPSYQ